MSNKDSSTKTTTTTTTATVSTTTPLCNSIHPMSEASQPPKVTPPNAPTVMSKTKRGRPPAPTTARRKIESPPEPSFQPQIDDDEYAKFVESLNLDTVLMGDDDEEFKLTDTESDEDDDEEEDDNDEEIEQGDQSGAPKSSPNGKASDLTSPIPLPDIGTEFYSELEAELGSLLEEDLEAAVTTLLGTSQHMAPTPSKAKDFVKASPATPSSESPRTPLKEAARAKQTVITEAQKEQLASLMKQHYQLLIQQAVLSVRAAHGLKYSKPKTTNDMYCTETHEDLAEILDGAVGMLQDLDQNRKDAIRTSIQLDNKGNFSKRSLMPALDSEGDRRLTRAAFIKTLQTGQKTNNTCFDVKGLCHLNATFATLDKSSGTDLNILDPEEHGDACKLLLEIAGAEIQDAAIPGFVDVSTVLSDPKEFFGPDFGNVCTTSQNVALRRDRIQFTSAEDNLVLRGVNLYGEKQWMLIADRYLPDRSINVIAQRYSKLSIMVFRAHGINIDAEGNLEVPPKHEGVERADPKKVEALKKVAPPAILNVHRWSIEEDLTLLRGVPVMGHMWSELSTRLMPHRDRGHLRKRYQVLERRIKATITRAQREDGAGSKPPKPPKIPTQKAAPPRPVPTEMPAGATDHPSRFVPDQPFPGGMQSATSYNMIPHPPSVPLTWNLDGTTSTARAPVPFHMIPPPSCNGVNANRMPIPNVLPKPRRKPGYNLPVRSPPGATRLRTDDGSSGLNADNRANAQQNDNTTRLGFEKILNEANDEWSQMSRVKEMLENDTESMIATTIVNKLAKGIPPTGAPINYDRSRITKEWFQHVNLDTGSSSGMSTMNENERSNSFASPLKKRPRGPLLSCVMERSQKKSKTDDAAIEDSASTQYHGDEKKRPCNRFLDETSIDSI